MEGRNLIKERKKTCERPGRKPAGSCLMDNRRRRD
jgi:hypothetical protein